MCKFKPGDMVKLRDVTSKSQSGLVVMIDPEPQDIGNGREFLIQVLWMDGKVRIQWEHEIKKLME